jgi:secreted trypsin-like serine protease
MTRLLWLIVLLVASSTATASAIVIRHDVDDSKYRIPASDFPALVDMPGEGHGVLIAPQWVITAAHTIPGHSGLEHVVLNGASRDVERVVMHSGYKTVPQDLIDQAMASGEAILIVVFLASSDDIALVKLTQPVTDVAPVTVYKDSDEPGHVVKIVGKGATGTGDTGHDPRGPNRTELRRAFNKITSAYDRWFCYVFDQPPLALPLEGISGNGDSGGPVLIQVEDQWLLAGLSSWKVVQGDVRTARPGLYGQTACNVRLSHYVEWIESVISEQPRAGANISFKPTPLRGAA